MSETAHVMRDLRRLPAALMMPAPLVSAIAGTLAYFYVTLTLQVTEGWRAVLAISMLAVEVLVVLVVVLAGLRRLEGLRALGAGRVSFEKATLQVAVREVMALPDFLFFCILLGWGVAGLLVGGVMKVWGGTSWGDAWHIVAVGLYFGPVASLLSYSLVTLRARRAVRRLCEGGLSPKDLIASVPPKRAQLRARLVAFTAICVLVPAMLTGDLSSSLAQRGFHQMLQEKGKEAQREAAIRLRTESITSTLAMCGLVFLLAVATAYVTGTALGQPMREIAEEATRIAKGDLANPRPIPSEDEVWAVAAAFSAMQAHLTQVLTELKRAGVQVGTTTESIVATSARYEAGAAEQAAALNETSATTEELARSARQIAENAGSVSEIAHKTLSAAEGGQESAEAFSHSMTRMRQDNQAIADSVVKLNKRVQQIGKIVEFINGVANKSDLLALNAELEGTKAGEVGRGFSLVAAEMRRLAENIIESTKEIEGLIEEIREATSAAVVATGAGVKATDSGSALAQQVSESLKEIVQLAGQTSDAVRSISLATQQQQTGTDQLAEAMADILRVTQQSLAATKQVTSANVDLSSLAKDLKAVVERFRIEEGRR